MTPSIIGARSAQTSAALTISVARHPSEQPGDLLLLFGHSFSGGVVITSLPTAFQAWPTTLPNLSGFSSGKAHQYLGYAESSPPSTYDFTFTASSTRNTILTIVTVRGAHADPTQVINPFVDDRQNSTASVITLPTVTSLLTGDLVLRAISGQQATNTAGAITNSQWTSPLTEVEDDTLNGLFVSVASRVMASDGATGTAPVSFIDGSSNPVAATHYGRAFKVVAAPSTPVNTVAPVITGTAHSGNVLTCSDGTWTGSPTGITKQWNRDGVAIGGATAGTYTATVSDEGHTITCTVTATNGAGSTQATSGSVSIPITTAPVNTVLPSIVGSAQTGRTISASSGTWTGGGTISYTYEWRRDASTVLGSGSTYTLVHADESHAITCVVTATNTAGSAAAASDPVTPATTAGLAATDITLRYSGGISNQSQAASIGGAEGDPITTPVALFGSIPGTVAQSGGVFYRVVYVHNGHPFDSLTASAAFIDTQETHPGLEIAVGVPTQAAGQSVPTLTSGTTAPEGITFTTATSRGTGQDFGTLASGQSRGLYVRLTVQASTAPNPNASGIIAVEGDPA